MGLTWKVNKEPDPIHEAIDQSRNVLLTADYPDLREYAHIMGKMVEARNAFLAACSYILQQDSAIGDCDSPCKLLRKHLELVRNLRESEVQLSHRLALENVHYA